MAKGRKKATQSEDENGSEEGTRKRNFADYVFEEHFPDGEIRPMGLVLNYPQEAAKVKEWLTNNAAIRGVKGTIRIAKKIYS